MAISHRVSYQLLADDIKSLIDIALKAYPVTYDYVFTNINPNGYDFVHITNGEHINEIYKWVDSSFQPIGTHEHTHTQSQIIDFTHNHEDLYYDKTIVEDKLGLKADKEIVISVTQPTNGNMWYKEII